MYLIYLYNGITHIAAIPDKSKIEQSNPEIRQMSWEQFKSWVAAITIPQGATDGRFIEGDMLFIDREFRNALKPDFSYDMDQCAEITRGRLRAEREALMREQDIAQLNAETPQEIAKIKAEKQRLRDVTKLVNRNMTRDEMRSIRAKASATP